jgi:hypothetical protein
VSDDEDLQVAYDVASKELKSNLKFTIAYKASAIQKSLEESKAHPSEKKTNSKKAANMESEKVAKEKGTKKKAKKAKAA